MLAFFLHTRGTRGKAKTLSHTLPKINKRKRKEREQNQKKKRYNKKQIGIDFFSVQLFGCSLLLLHSHSSNFDAFFVRIDFCLVSQYQSNITRLFVFDFFSSYFLSCLPSPIQMSTYFSYWLDIYLLIENATELFKSCGKAFIVSISFFVKEEREPPAGCEFHFLCCCLFHPLRSNWISSFRCESILLP